MSGVGGALGGVSGAARRWSTATGQSHHSQDHGEHLGHQYILGWVEFFLSRPPHRCARSEYYTVVHKS